MNELIDFFHRGGILVMGSIAFVLVGSIIIIIERIVKFWSFDLLNSAGFMAAVQKMVMNNSIENAIRLCKKAKPKLVPFIISEGLKRANDTSEEIEYAMETATLSAVPQVNKFVAMLGTAANIATLLGLLGTIFGLIKSFGAAASAGGVEKQRVLAEGISEALTATSFGLGTALFCILAHGLLTMKQQSIVADIHKNVAKLTELLYTRQMKIKGRNA